MVAPACFASKGAALTENSKKRRKTEKAEQDAKRSVANGSADSVQVRKLGVLSKGAISFMFICPLDTNFLKIMSECEEFNVPIESFGDSRSPELPAYVVYRCGDRIPLELLEELPLVLLPDVPSYPSQRGKYYADSILFVTLSRYTAEKYCLCHKNCAFIVTRNLDEALSL